MTSERLTVATQEMLDQINVLLRQLSVRVPACTLELLKDIVASDTLELWVVRDEETLLGMGELAIVLKPEGVIAQIEDVVVDEKHRGKGIGNMISEKLIERARARNARVIQLSSRPARIAANALYTKLGFKSHETNSYYLNL